MSWSELGGWRELGASWSELGGWRELGASWERAAARGMSWSELGGWRELGSKLEQGEQAGASWEQGEPAGGFLRPMVVGTLKPSITFVSLPSLQLAPRCEPPGETFTT